MSGDLVSNIFKVEKGIPNHNAQMEGVGEPDTCRICRGEGDHSEVLFHPCKCSGSIKFVHQDCLMEWLSHSQKKHCELCKTAFRFTKLYSPNMPQSLPLHVLIRYFLIHTIKFLTSFLRLCLVVVVWLALLPYAIRQVWRLLFWFSDGGWPPNHLAAMLYENYNNTEALQLAIDIGLQKLADNESPEASISTFRTNSGYLRKIMKRLAGFLIPASPSLNKNGSDIMAAEFLKSIYDELGIQSPVFIEKLLKTSNSSTTSMSSSLLSDISFFRNLTRSSSFNQVVINITEGYIITILVVFCFVLVFLIREWVVQQQPGINWGMGFNAELAANERPRDEQQNLAPMVDVGAEDRPAPERDFRPVTQLERDNNFLELYDEDRNPEIDRLVTARNASTPVSASASASATENQRSIADEPGDVGDILEIWNRAEGDLAEIPRNTDRKDRTEEFTNIPNQMKTLPNLTKLTQKSTHTPTPEITSPIGFDKQYSQNSSGITGNGKEKISQVDGIESEALRKDTTWPGIPRSVSPSQLFEQTPLFKTKTLGAITETSKDKGKSPAYDYNDLVPTSSKILTNDEKFIADSSYFEPTKAMMWESSNILSTLRPRSVSDSPQLKGPSPLSTNSWTFPRVSMEKEESETAISNDNSQAKKSKNLKNKAMNLGFESNTRNSITPSDKATRIGKSVAELGSSMTSSLQEENKLDIDSYIQITAEQNSLINKETTSTIESGVDTTQDGIIQNSFSHPSVHIPETRDSVVVRPIPRTIFGTINDFLWGEIDNNGPHEDLDSNVQAIHEFVDDIDQALEIDENDNDQANNPDIANEFVQEAVAEGENINDPDAIEDAEDFEGIMELLGMRGPIFSLIQNALFSAVLLAVNITVGIWTPYNIGRISLLLIANPGFALQMPLRIMFGCAAFLQDLALSVLGMLVSIIIQLATLPCNFSSVYFGARSYSVVSQATHFGSAATEISLSAFERVKNDAISNVIYITDPEISILSAACHESLIIIRNLGSSFLKKLGTTAICIFTGKHNVTWENTINMLKALFPTGVKLLKSIPEFLINPESWIIGSNGQNPVVPIDLKLSIWNGSDRFFAILTGYAVLCILGALYVKKRSPYVSRQAGRDMEAVIIDLLNQAGGVMKVILIISIEMLAFPLYCGLLLDIALLPLFENTTILSRILFTLKSPLTSIFVHWFFGTCYMFHFALFVSMCRKIMRKGVLCKFPNQNLNQRLLTF